MLEGWERTLQSSPGAWPAVCTARTQLAAAACSRMAPQQEALGFWYFLRAQLAGHHLYSLDQAPAGIPRILSKQEISAYHLFLNLSAPKQNHPEKQFIHQHAGPTFQLLGINRDNIIDFNKSEATRFLFCLQKEELKKIFKDFDISGDEVKLEKLQSKERL